MSGGTFACVGDTTNACIQDKSKNLLRRKHRWENITNMGTNVLKEPATPDYISEDCVLNMHH